MFYSKSGGYWFKKKVLLNADKSYVLISMFDDRAFLYWEKAYSGIDNNWSKDLISVEKEKHSILAPIEWYQPCNLRSGYSVGLPAFQQNI